MRSLMQTFVEEGSRQLGIAADLLRIEGNGPLAQIDGRIRPEILTMESLHPLYVRVRKAGVGQREFRVSLYSLFKQIDCLLVLVLLVELVKSPTAQVEIVGCDVFSRFLANIGPFIRR